MNMKEQKTISLSSLVSRNQKRSELYSFFPSLLLVRLLDFLYVGAGVRSDDFYSRQWQAS